MSTMTSINKRQIISFKIISNKLNYKKRQYFAALPWKSDHPPLPSSFENCKNRLSQVTSRLNKLGHMDQYCKVMEEHLSKGYIEVLSDIKQPWPEQGCLYLPHFFVLKDSETTPPAYSFRCQFRERQS